MGNWCISRCDKNHNTTCETIATSGICNDSICSGGDGAASNIENFTTLDPPHAFGNSPSQYLKSLNITAYSQDTLDSLNNLQLTELMLIIRFNNANLQNLVVEERLTIIWNDEVVTCSEDSLIKLLENCKKLKTLQLINNNNNYFTTKILYHISLCKELECLQIIYSGTINDNVLHGMNLKYFHIGNFNTLSNALAVHDMRWNEPNVLDYDIPIGNASDCDSLDCDTLDCDALDCNALDYNELECCAPTCNTLDCDALDCNTLDCDIPHILEYSSTSL